MEEICMRFDTLKVSREGAVLFVDIAVPPMNLLGPELVRDLVSLIQQAEADNAVKVLVFRSADPDYFISRATPSYKSATLWIAFIRCP
jgi:enoyl-CoA hydratase/carnithine racemase